MDCKMSNQEALVTSSTHETSVHSGTIGISIADRALAGKKKLSDIYASTYSDDVEFNSMFKLTYGVDITNRNLVVLVAVLHAVTSAVYESDTVNLTTDTANSMFESEWAVIENPKNTDRRLTYKITFMQYLKNILYKSDFIETIGTSPMLPSSFKRTPNF